MIETKDEFLQSLKSSKRLYKLCLVGDGATGKTTFLRYLATGDLVVCHEGLKRTPYIDFGSTRIEGNTIQIIDLAGQRFDDAHPLDHIPVAALRGADIIVFFFSLENFHSFLSIKSWFDEIQNIFERWNSKLPACILVGNKSDLTRSVESINGIEFASHHPEFRSYFEISLLDGEGLIILVNAIQEIMNERSAI
ncbi:MAG: ADP-ribosylation factor-like protein [Candidatus Thorarchaeota archaeon]